MMSIRHILVLTRLDVLPTVVSAAAGIEAEDGFFNPPSVVYATGRLASRFGLLHHPLLTAAGRFRLLGCSSDVRVRATLPIFSWFTPF